MEVKMNGYAGWDSVGTNTHSYHLLCRVVTKFTFHICFSYIIGDKIQYETKTKQVNKKQTKRMLVWKWYLSARRLHCWNFSLSGSKIKTWSSVSQILFPLLKSSVTLPWKNHDIRWIHPHFSNNFPCILLLWLSPNESRDYSKSLWDSDICNGLEEFWTISILFDHFSIVFVNKAF